MGRSQPWSLLGKLGETFRAKFSNLGKSWEHSSMSKKYSPGLYSSSESCCSPEKQQITHLQGKEICWMEKSWLSPWTRNEYFINKKQARSDLRQAVNKHQAAESRKENNELMNANFCDPKLFSKLVNKRRLNNQGCTTMLKIEETFYKGDAQVLAGFFVLHTFRKPRI